MRRKRTKHRSRAEGVNEFFENKVPSLTKILVAAVINVFREVGSHYQLKVPNPNTKLNCPPGRHLSGISCRTSILSFVFLLILLNEQFAFESDA